jgi:DNA-binding NarL/FixJ family response regulator
MAQTPLKLLLFDRDPIFRLGFLTAIKTNSQIKIIGDGESVADILSLINQELPDVIIFDLGLNEGDSWQFCQEIGKKFPKINLFLLGYNLTNSQLNTARKVGVKGYCQKGISLDKLIAILNQIKEGKPYWPSLPMESKENELNVLKLPQNNNFLLKNYQSGLRQVNEQIKEIEEELKINKLSRFEKQFLLGRKRELIAARWLINQIFSFSNQSVNNQQVSPNYEQNLLLVKENSNLILKFPDLINLDKNNSPIQPLLENTLNFIKFDFEILNKTDSILEIDILKPLPKKELLYLILSKIYRKLEEAKFLKISPEELAERNPLILTQIWQETALDFIVQNSAETFQKNLETIKEIIVKDTLEIQQEILSKIPLVKDLFNYWVFQETILIDQVPYGFHTPEGNQRAEFILQNLIIHLANGVMETILNYFSEGENIKDKLFYSRYYSSREMAKFRNIISAQYRKNKLLIEPTQIFESQYPLFYFKENKIESILIYYPRQKELELLKGFPWLITISLEFRDAIAPILKGIISFLGKGLVYFLTQVIGRGLGLIGKGILQGVGYTLQDIKK